MAMSSRHKRRKKMFHMQFGLCYWCENARGAMSHDKSSIMHRSRVPHHYATFDELIPRSRGGRKTADNQVIAHSICNLERGNTIATRKAVFPSEVGVTWLRNHSPQEYQRYLTMAAQVDAEESLTMVFCEEVVK